MKKIEVKINPKVESVFNNYPDSVRKKMNSLRELIIETANKTEGITNLEETLKWGEPSYLTKKGSTIRIDWKSKNPNQYAMYFQCTSRLVSTFRTVYKNTLDFEGKRAIILQLKEDLPKEALKNCIATALTYHKVKHLPLLGM
ncbi:DUF1801 domain-containing protein [Flavivirga spongiicola]|uniref:DUF1801 domain-containing protein n=1 Tax=Flavivirga spongiicola TaxID=421621 RepID=A0ABU7XUP0_9FLAO|nr:DUF1801 domain-containing protein [Flavivirga sp. MEBiC05379]MDO5979496.1 DUF1801 domain-containing protein [Flavivirga sp. MEBiC05379]